MLLNNLLVNCHFEIVESALGLVAGTFEGIVSTEDNGHAAVSVDFGLAEDSHLGAGLGKHLVEIAEFDGVGFAFDHYRT